MAENVVIDALPYFDRGYDDPGVREAAMELIEREMHKFPPTKNYLEHLPAPDHDKFLTPLMKAELARITSKKPMELMQTERYTLPAPTPGLRHDPEAWNKAVENSKAQLQHQLVRIENLELMADYGAQAWLKYNETLNQMVSDAQNKLQQIRKDIQEVNWQRKDTQQRAGQTLSRLENEWATLVHKNYEIEEVLIKLENEKNNMKAGRSVKKQFGF
ncbi:Oidioi.mRNA.OKI2018_I69.chr1.g2271.t1.cds [Oikopleura dioica]|uniref:Pre-mRNA-splicing factor SPF27 n=1 Tax=Oikopleura dioica TaxID=34765 RepID=A0ABN7SQM5_OIKDI|nr:Oidioi.mRNA.OKI2018_I69.chr1.g2271.t1.cds [Oikopleura dioica]